MGDKKKCPYCAETVNSKALVCRYCQSNLGVGQDEKDGELIRVRVKTHEKIYNGEIFVPYHFNRISDVINDPRPFILLTNAKEESKTSEIDIGFIAVNKSIVEWVRMIGHS